MAPSPRDPLPDISVVVPVFDEEGAAPALAREIAENLADDVAKVSPRSWNQNHASPGFVAEARGEPTD